MHKASVMISRIILILLTVSPAWCRVVSYRGCVVDDEIWSLPSCALKAKDDHLYVAHRYLRLYFPNKKRLAWAMLPGSATGEGGWAYFNETGRIVVQEVATMDNGPNDFHHGLVRVVHKGKWGLADSRGTIVVPLKYDGMLDYDEHSKRWMACTGCHDVAYVGGEHSGFEGGEWFWLDGSGQLGGKAKDPVLHHPR